MVHTNFRSFGSLHIEVGRLTSLLGAKLIFNYLNLYPPMLRNIQAGFVFLYEDGVFLLCQPEPDSLFCHPD